MMLMTCLVTQRITDKSVSEFNYWRRFLAVLGCNPAIIESSPQNFPGSAEYFLGSLLTLDSQSWCGCGEWRVMAASDVYRGQRAREQERQECGSWRAEFDWFHHHWRVTSHQGVRADCCTNTHTQSKMKSPSNIIWLILFLPTPSVHIFPRVKFFFI